MGRIFAMTLAAVALAGCQTMNEVASVVTGPSEKTVPQTTPQPAAAVAAQPAAVNRSSSGIVGMAGDALREAWGEPSLKRTENGAELWQYGSGKTCTLLIYLYANGASAMTVSHAEALPGGTDEAALAACAKTAGKPPLKPIS